jgi:hypothetical protein
MNGGNDDKIIACNIHPYGFSKDAFAVPDTMRFAERILNKRIISNVVTGQNIPPLEPGKKFIPEF